MAESLTPEQQAAALEGFMGNPHAVGYSQGYSAGLQVRDQQITSLLDMVEQYSHAVTHPGQLDTEKAMTSLLQGLRQIVGSHG